MRIRSIVGILIVLRIVWFFTNPVATVEKFQKTARRGPVVNQLEALHKQPTPNIPQPNLTKPIHDFYFPTLYASLLIHNLPCVGILDRKPLPPKPLPQNPRYVLLVDSWERQQTGTKTVESVASIVDKFGLVFVMPHVRMSNIQGIPGWTQWQSSHALDGFTSARYLLPMSEYYDVDYSRGYLPMISFEEWKNISRSTITTALFLDWEKNQCKGNVPEWYPVYGADIQATQLYCMHSDFPAVQLKQAHVDEWFTPGKGVPIPEAEGRQANEIPSVALLNWRKHALGDNVWFSDLWKGKCRFRWNNKWNRTAVEWQRRHLPRQYVALKIRSGDWLRDYWLPKQREDVQTCFDHMVEAVLYYHKLMGLPPDAPTFIATEWPHPPESRWWFPSMQYLTAAFNSLYQRLNLVTYKNPELDIGIVTIIQFDILLNAAIVVGLEDTMLGLVRQYRPSLPLALVGSQSGRKCDNWNPPAKDAPPHRFLYLVQGHTFLEKMKYSDDSDLLCLTWGTRSEHCDFEPQTTWTSGRNHLWMKAVRLPRRYDYYIFLDDDVTLTSVRDFEAKCLKWRPAVAVPGAGIHLPTQLPPDYTKETEALKITSYAALFNAYHHDVFFNSLVLPYWDGQDEFSWWSSQLYAIYLAQIFHPDELYGFQTVGVGNAKHGKYPQNWDLDIMNKPFIEECLPDSEFREAHWKHFASEAQVQHTPLPADRSHSLSKETLDKYLNQPTKYWQRIREIRDRAFSQP
uniref:Uncharacterized protein n=1 Tax=Eutreptiella gymnastica TaxID=73025 RepID=A0A7S4GEM1_9EUGL